MWTFKKIKRKMKIIKILKKHKVTRVSHCS